MAKIKLSSVKAPLQKGALTAAGVFAATKIDGFIPATGMLADAKVKAGIKIVAGILLPSLLGKGKVGGLVADFSAGLATVGILQLANETVLSANKVSISGTEFPTLGYSLPQPAAGQSKRPRLFCAVILYSVRGPCTTGRRGS